MKLYDIITLSVREMKLGWKLLVPALVASSLMVAVAIILLNVSSSSMDVIYAQFDSQFSDGLTVDIVDAEIDDIDTLKSLGINNISVEVTSTKISNSTLTADGETLSDGIFYCIMPFWYDEDTDDEYATKLGISYGDNDGTSAFVLCAEEDYDYWSGISAVEVYDPNGNSMGTFTVQAVVCDDEMYEAYVYLPFQTLYTAYNAYGVYPSHSISTLVKPVSNYAVVKQTLLDNGFTVYSDVDDLSDNTAMLSAFFKAMSVIIILLGILSLVTMCRMYFNSRQTHIVLQRVLGMTPSGVFAILYIIIELLLVVACVIAMIIVVFGNDYIYGVLSDVFGDFDYAVSGTFWAGLAAFVVANIASAAAAVGIYIKIKRIELVSQLGGND